MIQDTPTAQLRRVTIPQHRRKAQVKQTLWGVFTGASGVGLVWLLGVSEVWYLVAILFGLRIASKELLLDCLKIAREVVGIFTGAKRDEPPVR